MTQQSIVLPWLRVSPVHIPRRDLVLAAADSLGLTVTVVETDNPGAPAIEVSGGIGGPLLSLFIWPSACGHAWDYGAPWVSSGSPLWSGDFTIADAATATFAIAFPPGTMAAWPRRACWSVQLTENHGASVSQLAWGNLHAMPSGMRLVTPTAIVTDPGSTILTDPGTILVA